MFVELIPEIIGLILTPAAIAGCILLLQSQHPLVNALAFGSAFIVLYAAISIAVVAIGGTVEQTDDTSTAKGVVSITIGVLFLLIGAVIALHHKRTREGPPKWTTMLETAHPTGAFVAGSVLALANPNVFLLLSGLGIVVTEGGSDGERVGGVVVLLGAVALDFVVPIVLFVLLGATARRWLDSGKAWLVGHDRQLTLVIMFGFGALFVIRGLGGL